MWRAVPLLLAASLGGCGGETFDLTYRFRDGEEVVQRHVFETSGGNLTGSRGRLRTELTLRKTVLQAAPESSRVRFAMERIVAEIGPEGKEPYRFDSAAPAPESETSGAVARVMTMLGHLAGESFEGRCGPGGDIESFEGLESLAERVKTKLPAGDPRGALLSQFLQPASLRFQAAPLVKVPADPVALGAEWDHNEIRLLPAENTGIPAYLYCTGRARLAEVKDGRARVEVKGKVALDPPPGAPDIPLALKASRALLRLDRGQFSAFVVLDIATGALLESEHSTELDLALVKLGGEGETDLDTVMVWRIEPSER